MPGLPFQSMPAAQAGTPQTLGNLKTKQDELVYPSQLGRMAMDPTTGIPEPVYTEADYQRRPDGTGGPVVELAPTPAPVQQDAADPFAMLEDQLQQAHMARDKPLFDQQEQMIQSQVKKTESDLLKQFQIEEDGLAGVDVEQGQKRHQQLQTKYNLAFAKATSEVEPAMQELAAKRQEWESGLNAERTERAIKLRAYDDAVKAGTMRPEDALKQKYSVYGVNYVAPQEQRQTPVQQMAELRQYRSALEDTVRSTQRDKKGRVVENYGSDDEPDWQIVSSERAAEIEEMWRLYEGWGDEITRIAAAAGRKTGLGDIARQQASPIAKAIKKARPTPTPSEMRAMGPFGSGAAALASAWSNRSAAAPTPQAQQSPKYMKNPTTGQRAVSYDGGNTWQPATN